MSYEFIWTSSYRQSDLFAFIEPQDFQIMLENMIIRFYASLVFVQLKCCFIKTIEEQTTETLVFIFF